MKVTETAQIPTKQFEEAIWSRKHYLDTARGHYLSALAGLSGGKQVQTKISPNSDSPLLLEDHVCNQAAEAEQASTPEQEVPEKTFSDMDVQMQVPNRVLKASERDLEAVKLQFIKTLARNTKSQITEMICKLGSLGNEMDINDAANFNITRTVSSESDDAKQPLPKTAVERSSLHRMVESLKTKLENLKKEHAELSDIDAGAESAARNLHFSLFRSEPEKGDCFANRIKARETSEEVIQDKDDTYDLNIKARGLKREQDAAKFSEKVVKRPRIAHDVDKENDCIVSSVDLAKIFPEKIHPACLSTSESSARVMISEDELESSSQQVEKSDKLDRGSLIATTGGVEGENCDYASEFSIRDFVFSARNRDISLNWPFSQKNLQLCLKHGVKDVLPPFQPTDPLRDTSMNNCSAEKILHSEESNVDEKQPMLKNHIVSDTILELDHSWNQDLAEGYRDSDSFPIGGEGGLVFKTIATANCQSEVESVSTSNLPLSEVSDEREAAGSAANKTNSSASQLSSKKVKVAVKIRVSSKRNTPEDITSACTGPPETISSKICPVCENFSSSSNTTLNAHIDQCLSSQSPPIWMKSSKLMKPRIKPRKIRLMTDICATAPSCTLEDLDRRNGTNWATNVDFPLEEADVPSEQISPVVSSKYLVQNVDDGSVYIDSSGRKIRILSKLNDTSTSSFSKAREDPRPKKQSRKAKRSKVISPNRKKRLAKHLKFLKVTRQRKRSLSFNVKGRSSEACGLEEAMHAVGDKQQTASFVKGLEAEEHNNPGNSGAIIKLSRCEHQAAKDSLIGNDQVGSTEVEPRGVPVKNFPKRSLSSMQNNTRTHTIYPAGVDQRSEGSCRVRMLGGRSLRGAIRGNREALPVSLKPRSAQFNRKMTKESTPKSSDSTMAPAPPLEREAGIQPNALQKADVSFPATRGLLHSCLGGSSERMRPCNSKTTLLPNDSFVRACQANSDKMGSALENSCDFSGDEETEAWPTGANQQSGAAIDHPKGPRIAETFGRSGMVEVLQKQASEYGENGSKDTNSNDDLVDGAHGNYSSLSLKGLHNDREFIASVSSSTLAIGVIERSLRTTFDPELEKVADVSQSKLLQCSDKFHGSLYRAEVRSNSTHPGLNDEHNMFHGNIADAQRLEPKTGDYILNFGHGFLFPEVDPIPIPGPPGSDLPSFSDMGSEDLHRSSLSNSLVQPSGANDNVADGDLSESPFSATSTISNLGRRTDNVTVNGQESLSVSLSASDSIYPGWFGSSGPLPGISTESSRFPAAASERATCVYSSENGMVDIGRGPPMLNRDIQQCCCSQKEETTQSTVTSQESQLLQWRPTSPKSFPRGNYMYSTLDGHSIDLDDRSAVFSSSSFHKTESVNLAHSVETSHQSITSLESSLEAADPFPRSGEYGSTSPAPILRLMGKDLMVSNQVDADLSRSQAAINVNVSKLVKSWEPQSSQSPTFMGPLPHGQDPDILPVRHFNVGPSNVMHSFGSHNPASEGMYLNEHTHASFSVLGAGLLRR
ncbi:uncharacterized protein LOC110707051 [Chenopodium quinoa]|uniref:Uncharacterized protein n=1 Tax=Chenopodium quinoa TaxID=63459 RepID=A0A803LQB9_CHEQI|nr:uncharacterized protein LOC110707051 [Chenopodium quinoa]